MLVAHPTGLDLNLLSELWTRPRKTLSPAENMSVKQQQGVLSTQWSYSISGFPKVGTELGVPGWVLRIRNKNTDGVFYVILIETA